MITNCNNDNKGKEKQAAGRATPWGRGYILDRAVRESGQD